MARLRAKYIDCGAGQIGLWQAALPDYRIEVDVNLAAQPQTGGQA